jgi:hypothetical protein
MKEFRRKLIVVLVQFELNKIKGKPIYYKPTNEENVSTSDCMIVEGLKQLDLSDKVHIIPTNPRKLVDELFQHIMSIQDPKLLEYVSSMLKKYDNMHCYGFIIFNIFLTGRNGCGAPNHIQ